VLVWIEDHFETRASFAAAEIPEQALHAVAKFISAGLNGPLDPKLLGLVSSLQQSGKTQFVVYVRPDLPAASCQIASTDDGVEPVSLFTLTRGTTGPDVIRH
jgi:hypothetical protein